jgi:hypothetical protein
MKAFAWTLLALATLLQLLSDFSGFFLPSMAAADGVAVYPPAGQVLMGFFYHSSAYMVAAACLALIPRWKPKMETPLAVAAMLAVLSPLGAIAVWSIAGGDASYFRENFWPIRPLVQLAVFAMVAAPAGVVVIKRP